MADARIRAPELPDTLQWINTNEPVKLADLRGKVVLLNLWTAGCINCMHTLDDLHYLDNKYRDKLAVISIHSPKFPRNQQVESVVKAVNRYHIKHPVAQDSIKRVWTKYAIKSWPSIVIIDAEGYVVGCLRGVGRRKQLDGLIRRYLEVAEKKNIINLEALSIRPNREPADVINFPGKICVTESYLYVSDSGYNRVLEINHYGRVTRVFGSGAAGLLDGSGENSAFNNPQGLLFINDFLYVADAGNHAIR
ncbi:MAG: redoxin domain-containing protein, partial [Gammaproteobacteria bacterium]|nr:redoxin domain-containing protein [Gammaproteobacteria bacterium]